MKRCIALVCISLLLDWSSALKSPRSIIATSCSTHRRIPENQFQSDPDPPVVTQPPRGGSSGLSPRLQQKHGGARLYTVFLVAQGILSCSKPEIAALLILLQGILFWAFPGIVLKLFGFQSPTISIATEPDFLKNKLLGSISSSSNNNSAPINTEQQDVHLKKILEAMGALMLGIGTAGYCLFFKQTSSAPAIGYALAVWMFGDVSVKEATTSRFTRYFWRTVVVAIISGCCGDQSWAAGMAAFWMAWVGLVVACSTIRPDLLTGLFPETLQSMDGLPPFLVWTLAYWTLCLSILVDALADGLSAAKSLQYAMTLPGCFGLIMTLLGS